MHLPRLWSPTGKGDSSLTKLDRAPLSNFLRTLHLRKWLLLVLMLHFPGVNREPREETGPVHPKTGREASWEGRLLPVGRSRKWGTVNPHAPQCGHRELGGPSQSTATPGRRSESWEVEEIGQGPVIPHTPTSAWQQWERKPGEGALPEGHRRGQLGPTCLPPCPSRVKHKSEQEAVGPENGMPPKGTEIQGGEGGPQSSRRTANSSCVLEDRRDQCQRNNTPRVSGRPRHGPTT